MLANDSNYNGISRGSLPAEDGELIEDDEFADFEKHDNVPWRSWKIMGKSWNTWRVLIGKNRKHIK